MFGVRAGMRSARGPSSSRRHTGIEPRARTSSTSPSVRSLATTLPAAPRVSFGEVQGHGRRAARPLTGATIGCRSISRDPPFGWRRRLPPSPPKPRNGDEAGGGGSNRALLPGRGHDTTALFWTQCQSFLDNIIAGFRPNLSLNDPCPDEVRRAPGLLCIESDFSYGRIRFELDAEEIRFITKASDARQPAEPPPRAFLD